MSMGHAIGCAVVHQLKTFSRLTRWPDAGKVVSSTSTTSRLLPTFGLNLNPKSSCRAASIGKLGLWPACSIDLHQGPETSILAFLAILGEIWIRYTEKHPDGYRHILEFSLKSNPNQGLKASFKAFPSKKCLLPPSPLSGIANLKKICNANK